MSDRRQGFGGRARTILRVGALLLVAMLLRALPAATAAGSYDANDPVQAAEYSSARHLGVQAFLYGYPLLDLDRVFKTGTSATVPNGSGGGPVNEFSHFRRFTIPSDATVVAPSHDTLYSMAWLDLVPQPIVMHGPHVSGRFIVFEFVDRTPRRSRRSAPSAFRAETTAGSRQAGARACREGSKYSAPRTRASGSSDGRTSTTRQTLRTSSGSRTSTRSHH